MVSYVVFFIGVILVVVSLIYLKKNTGEDLDTNQLNEEKIKLLECIEIAEEVIRELNTTSEEVIDRFNEKTLELHNILNALNLKIKDYEAIKEQTLEKVSTPIILDYEYVPNDNEKKIEDHDIDENENKMILELYHKGNSPSQIAKKLNRGIGEIQLILNLKKG